MVMTPDRIEYEDRPNGVHWSILDADGEVLYERTSPDRDRAEREAGHHYKLFELGAHYLQAARKGRRAQSAE